MALPSIRLEYRIALSNVDRGVELQESVVVALHPSETMEHATLRVLAWCLLHEEGLAFGPGLCDGDAADLWRRDPTGRVLTWVECGTARAEVLKKIVQHHAGAATHVVLSDRRRREELRAEVAALPRLPRGFAEVTVWMADPALVAALAAGEARRRRWTVTIVGDHAYVEADGVPVDGPIVRESLV